MIFTITRKPSSYLQKPVHKMTIHDFTNLAEKATKHFMNGIEDTNKNSIAQSIMCHDFCDMFTLSGKLNKQTKKDLKMAIKTGDLPKKATIQDFFNKVISLE